MKKPKYSIIIPVYNRPQELNELLLSLKKQTFRDFELIIVDDGSIDSSEPVIMRFLSEFYLSYHHKANSGPGPSRNYGFEKAKGDYFIVFDSDCLIPSNYLATIDTFQNFSPLDVWGGSDKGSPDFTPKQQAMACTMSSIFTTGGIRGGNPRNFQPRSFNMGMTREVYKKTGGFLLDRLAEDIEFSIRAKKMGFKVGLIPQAFVYHKRRTDFAQFFKQVANFGAGRIVVGRAHPGSVKLTHWFPAFFLMGMLLLPVLTALLPFYGLIGLCCYVGYFILIALHGLAKTESIKVALLCIPAAFIQLTGYGYGFLRELLNNKKPVATHTAQLIA
jgi:glycosyltransferase involved in cell wall biosynthesis